MELYIYNTLSRKKERFQPIHEGHVGIYFCGPTVYSDPHLGHARGPIFFDLVKRWLVFNGYRVRLISNITDVGHLTDDGDEGEDKLLKRAVLEKLEPMEIADKYFWAYADAMKELGVRRPDIMPRATGHISEQIELSQRLIERGHAYESNGSVYFDVNSWPDYGKLSGRKLDEALEGTRVEVREDKRDPRDFALWKKAEPSHIMRWPSPWGEGFPGWHIECSVMSMKYLGENFDIHGGGLDLNFPHHECEMAQSQAAGHAFANYWMHWNFITLSGEKMAKSKGHFKTLTGLFAEYDPNTIRFNLLASHYRSVSDFSPEGLHASGQGLKRLQESYNAVLRQHEIGRDAPTKDPLQSYRDDFSKAMNDDFNTPQAIATLFDGAKAINAQLGANDPDFIAAAKAFYDDYFVEILGLSQHQSEDDSDIVDGLVQLIAETRAIARQKRDFATADAIRDSLKDMGLMLEDGPEGTRWKRL